MKPNRRIILSKTLDQEFAGTTFGYDKEVSPKFRFIDKNVLVYVEYEGNAFVFNQFNDYNICYSGAGTIPFKVLRKIAKKAGVHIYYEGNDLVYVNSRMIGIHHVKDHYTITK